MDLLRLFRHARVGSLLEMLFLSVVASAFFVGPFLLCSDFIPGGSDWPGSLVLGLTLLSMAAFVGLEALAMARTCEIYEDAISSLRAKLVGCLTSSEYPVVRGVGTTEILAVAAGSASVVAAQSVFVSQAVVSSVLVLIASIPVAYVSPVSYVIFAVFGLASYAWYALRPDFAPLRQGEDAELRLRAAFTELLAGPRELVVDRDKARNLCARLATEAEAAARARTSVGRERVADRTNVQALQFLGVLLILELSRMGVHGVQPQPWALLLLAIFASRFFRVLNNRADLRIAGRAAHGLLVLEAGLRTAQRVAPPVETLSAFRELRLEGVELRRRRADAAAPFVLGPLSLQLAPGTVTFLRGPNGSGKSTLLELLLGLWKPGSGTILLDGTPVTSENLGAYRSLFAPVFADPRLLDDLYGYRPYNTELGREWLRCLGLPPDLALDAPHRQTSGLSTGQRKRLALARAIVEGRPVLVLDEYTADQDAAARESFFREILPRLKAEGRAVIATIHGDVAPTSGDRVFQVRDGQLIPEAA
ncbi:MAG: ATP-binding cassette domain-containing protein [Planctomycetes bacterium]|nr:ATP-binding cassette domain-containing protein [Planctomycetota bacterium]